MSIKKSVKLLCGILIFLGFSTLLSGFSGETHKAITEKAAYNSILNDYLKSYLSIDQGLECMLILDQSILPVDKRIPSDQFEDRIPDNPCTIFDFLKTGAHLEDVPMPRARHHFHAPIANTGLEPPNPNAGLDNRTDYPAQAETIDKWSFRIFGLRYDLTGASAYERASETENKTQWQNEYENYFSWYDTRNHFSKALTESSPAVRDHYLALTFLSLGHVVHLLEDMGVPAHTRNDWLYGHYRNLIDRGNPFENWVEKKITKMGGLDTWSGSGPVVFDKLAKYFDTDTYAGDYLDGQAPPNTWGLAECSNYQFLSLYTVFGCSGIKYQFPHPAEEHTEPLPEVDKIYFDGSNYGVTHLARDSYTYYMSGGFGPRYPVISSTNTTDDGKVFIDYGDITIPRTIDYTTGLINYFFRGRLNVELTGETANEIELTITNTSITNTSTSSGILQTLKGGTFEVYWDDKNDNRTQITSITFYPTWTSESILPNDGGDTKLLAEFDPPVGEVIQYVVVYKGNINEHTADPDLDDTEAIAVGVCNLDTLVAWADDDGDQFGQVTDKPKGREFISVAAGIYHGLAVRSDGSIEAWGWDGYYQVSGKPTGNDFIAVAAGQYHCLALKSDGSIVGWGLNDDGQAPLQVTPSAGYDFIAISAGLYHSIALESNNGINGSIVAWGGNDYGQVSNTPGGTDFKAIAAGELHNLALDTDGHVQAWGDNTYGQTMVNDAWINKIHVAISACAHYNLLLRQAPGGNTLVTWGNDDWNDSPYDTTPNYHYRAYDLGGNIFKATAIAAGFNHFIAVTADGEIRGWKWPKGDYSYPITFDNFKKPEEGWVPYGIFTDDISAGYEFSLALKAQ